MKRIASSILLSAVIAVVFQARGIGAEDAARAALELGKATFDLHCARCHGPQGKGDGPDAKRVPVVPRDLTSGVFKFRSTASGTPPSDEDLMWILNHGLPGSGMPNFANLEKDAKEGLIAYIKTMSTAFKDFKPQPVTPPLERGKVNLKKGAEVFAKLQCALCHGEGGRANGTSAFTLMDGWGRPIKPADLTQGWTYRAGSSPRDVYYRLMAGINGTPMPSYDGAVTPEDAWQLANYVVSLQLNANWAYKITPKKVSEELPASFDDPLWAQAKRTDINLQNTLYQQGRREPTSINAVSVQALYNDKEAAFRLFWNDPKKSENGAQDSILIALQPHSYKGEPRQNLHTLYSVDAPPLDIMLWRASQSDSVGQRFSNLESALRASWTPDHALPAKAEYKDGLWQLTFKRSLKLDEKSQLTPDGVAYVGFAAWDGNRNETQFKHSASQWIPLEFDQAGGHH